MVSYPKVWRYDHPLVESLFEEGTVHLLEKVDGSNFRFALYEAEFADEYGELDGISPVDGDVIFGSKSRWRGVISDPIEQFDGNFWRALNYLRDSLSTSAIRTLHDTYGPVVFFAENMVEHSLEYNWKETPPLIGFDVYVLQSEPEDEVSFEGFLPVSDARDSFERIGIDFAPILEADIDVGEFNPEAYDIPESHWRDGIAEGVVIRNDVVGERGKIVSEEFQEKNDIRWGKQKSDATDDTELLVATYCTNARIRKQVHKLIQEEGYEFEKSIIEPLYHRVVHDIWEEEWAEIIQQDWTIEMKRIWPLVAKRCAAVVEVMLTNSDINNAPPEKLWSDVGGF